MNVRITKASKLTYWYSKLVGNSYPVFDNPVESFGWNYVCESEVFSDVTRYIAVEDCEIVSPDALTAIENWSDVEASIRALLPPDETISELFSLEVDNER